MSYSEAVERLLIARPLIDSIKNNRDGWHPSDKEFAALEAIAQVLEEFENNSELLAQAGWTNVDLHFFHSRLNYYYATCLPSLVS